MNRNAKIYQPAKTAMQSGRAKTNHWVLEFPRMAGMQPDPLMGWNSMQDTTQQLALKFASREEAEAYCASKNIAYDIIEPKKPSVPPKQYASNFSYQRRRAYDQNT